MSAAGAVKADTLEVGEVRPQFTQRSICNSAFPHLTQ